VAAQIVMMYRIPKDAAAFDLHYFDIHVPLAQLLPGLRKYEIVQGASVLESPEYHLKETFISTMQLRPQGPSAVPKDWPLPRTAG
jgi:uncharacterized protein (TIGR02118 family)